MPIETILILVVFATFMLWAFKTGYVKALSEEYVKKWTSFWEYPLDSQWAWGKSLKLKG